VRVFAASSATVLVAKFDADAHKETPTKFEVKGFPTLKWFPKGSLTPVDPADWATPVSISTPGGALTLGFRCAKRCASILRGDVDVPLRAPPKGRGRKHATAKAVHGAHEVDTALFDRLRALRRELAATRGVPPYVIFSDATLLELAARKPRTLDEFATIKGVGEKKLADLGETFLAAIADAG
jgi:hypothetical protein